ncbi:hypothetical protein R3P38DRAFT_2804953 [Favolaschia claudopus]|uniref:Uncharacterized protein n=1 Tax=Favolaschia claudopus TaxID=2862362 RepID=A0AAV9ZPF2_9AGAR
MTCTQSQALQGPDILARFRHVDFRLLESRGISRKTSYLPREFCAEFLPTGPENSGILGETDSVGGNSGGSFQTLPEWRQTVEFWAIDTITDWTVQKILLEPICPKWLTNHGSVTANGLTGLVDLLYGLERKPLESKRLSSTTRASSDRLNRTSQRALVFWQGVHNEALQVSGVLARFRDIDFNSKAPPEQRRKVGDKNNSTDVKNIKFFGSFGKEIEEHTIQQGSVRVNNGMQQDIGELATQNSRYRKGNQGHRSERRNVPQSTGIHGSVGGIHSVVGGIHSPSVHKGEIGPSYGNGESGAGFREKRTQHRGTGLEIDSVGGNSARNCFLPPRPTGIWQHNGNPATRLNSSTLQHYKDSAEKYCWNQICPKYLTNHGSVTANGPTGLIDLLYGLERKPLELNRLNSTTRASSDRLNRTSQRQHQSTDVKVGDNSTTQTLRFGKETADQAIQRGNARVSNGIQEDIGELAAHSCPLERKGNRRAPKQQEDVLKCTTRRPTVHHQVQYTTEPYSSHQPSLTLSNTFRVLYPPVHSALD